MGTSAYDEEGNSALGANLGWQRHWVLLTDNLVYGTTFEDYAVEDGIGIGFKHTMLVLKKRNYVSAKD